MSFRAFRCTLVFFALTTGACATTSSAYLLVGDDRLDQLHRCTGPAEIAVLAGKRGAGIPVSRSGHILTAADLIDDEDDVRVAIRDVGATARTTLRAEVLDTDGDLALLKVDRSFDCVAIFQPNPDAVETGEPVYGAAKTDPDDWRTPMRGYILYPDLNERSRWALTFGSESAQDAVPYFVELGRGIADGGGVYSEYGLLIGMNAEDALPDHGPAGIVPKRMAGVRTIMRFLDENDVPYYAYRNSATFMLELGFTLLFVPWALE